MTINQYFTEFLSLVNPQDNFEVLYITGKNYYDSFVEGKEFSPNVKIVPYLDNMSGLFADVDLIISRAGAGTIAEILTMEVPSILIPSPYVANNHQYYNALDLQNKKVGLLIEEKNLNAHRLYKIVQDLLQENTEYLMFKQNLQKLDTKNSSSIIYNQIKESLK